MGYFNVEKEVTVEIDIYDIIHNINAFNNEELISLQEAIENKINSKHNDSKNINILESNTIDEYYKIEILRDFFNKFTLEELDDIKKKII